MLEVIFEWKGVIGWLCVATYAKYVLKWSAKDLIETVFREASDAGRLKMTKPGINGLVFTGMLCLGILCLFAPTLLRLANLADGLGGVTIDPNLVFMGTAFLGITSLVGVLRG